MFSNLSCANEVIMAKSFEIENDEFEILVTRASSYEKSVLGLEEKPDNIRSKSSERNKFFFLCESHDDSKLWSTAINNPCPNCLNFEVTNSLPAGKLPTKLQVICFILTQKKLNIRSQCSSWKALACDLALHWIFCNVYPKSLKTIAKKLEECHKECLSLRKVQKSKRGVTYWKRYNDFAESCSTLFDILGNKEQIKVSEKNWNVRMSEEDYIFYDNQSKIPQVGYCSNFVDRKWQISNERKQMREERNASRKKESEDYKEFVNPVTGPELDVFDLGSVESEEECKDSTFVPTPLQSHLRYEFVETPIDIEDDMPHKYQFISNTNVYSNDG